MIEPHVRWMAPSPLWSEARDAGDTTALHQPSILRFATDSFMDDFLALLDADPSRLGEVRAVPETWRGPAPRPKPVEPVPAFVRTLSRRQLAEQAGGNGVAQAKKPTQAAEGSVHLKLYQPAHQRYYLVATNLVRRIPGFPDRALDPARPEKTSFVLRRLRAAANPTEPSTREAPAACVEYAFVTRDHQTGWQRVNATPGIGGDVLLPGEEELALSGVTFTEDDGRKRRLLIGLIPVGRREAYIGAPEISSAGAVVVAPPETNAPPPPNPRIFPLQVQITGPWINLIEQANAARSARDKAINSPPTSPFSKASESDLVSVIRTSRANIQTGSWYALVDLANYLDVQIHPVWQAITGESVTLDAATQPLYDKLSKTIFPSGLADTLLANDSGATRVPTSLADALVAARAAEIQLEAVTIPFAAGLRTAPSDPRWPTFLFPLADPIGDTPTGSATYVHDLENLISQALPLQSTGPVPSPQAVIQPALDPRGNDWFVVRCAFQRPNCDPITPPLMSEPTPAFELAGFFDPDAPARPIRIGLPVDISPAGLRKTNKNTVFVLSDLLCGQVKRAQGMTLGDLVLSVLPWPLHKDLPGDAAGPCTPDSGGPAFGMICSLSIPIITICALILLIIIVGLLDIIFHWLPYFMICFPFPRFRAKETS